MTPPHTDPLMAPDAWLRDGQFRGRVAFVTGGGSGIGEAICHMLAANGCAVAVADIAPVAAARVAGEIRAAGGQALDVVLDVADPAQAVAGVARAAQWQGGLDFLVNNAAAVLTGPLLDYDLAKWETSFRVNVFGALVVARAAFPHLSVRPGAALVHVASLAGGRAYPAGGAYGPSKAALISLTRQLAMEWAEHGIRANVVSPGTVKTPLMFSVMSEQGRAERAARIPLARLAEPREVASLVTYLLSPAASYVTGQEILIDGGLSQALMRQSFNATTPARDGAGRPLRGD